jgi:hypothetical protein
VAIPRSKAERSLTSLPSVYVDIEYARIPPLRATSVANELDASFTYAYEREADASLHTTSRQADVENDLKTDPETETGGMHLYPRGLPQVCPPGTHIICDRFGHCGCVPGFSGNGNGRNPCANIICPAGETCCPEGILPLGCYDLSSGNGYCGGCGIYCGTGYWGLGPCCNGACCPGASDVCCGGVCFDAQTDPNNCGGCSIECSAGNICCEGQCIQCDGTCCNGACCEGGCCNGQCVDLDIDPNNCGSCGNVCQVGNLGGTPTCTSGVCSILCPAPGEGCGNYKFVSSCGNITNLSVSMQVGLPLNMTTSCQGAPTSDGGFSFQLNTWVQPGSNGPLQMVQHVMTVQGGQITADIEGWDSSTGTCLWQEPNFWSSLLGCSGGETVTVWSDLDPDDELPADVNLTIELLYDASGNGNVIGSIYTVADLGGGLSGNPGYSLSAPIYLSANEQAPIVAIQAVIVGPYNALVSSFASGNDGTLTYWADNELICINGAPTLSLCSAPVGTGTCENSNISYSSISPCCGNAISQGFSVNVGQVPDNCCASC